MYFMFGVKFANFNELYNVNVLHILENFSQFEENSVLCLLKNSQRINNHEAIRSSHITNVLCNNYSLWQQCLLDVYVYTRWHQDLFNKTFIMAMSL